MLQNFPTKRPSFLEVRYCTFISACNWNKFFPFFHDAGREIFPSGRTILSNWNQQISPKNLATLSFIVGGWQRVVIFTQSTPKVYLFEYYLFFHDLGVFFLYLKAACLPRHCTEIWFMYSQKWSCAALFPIPTFMYLWAIYIFLGSVFQSGCSKIGRPILGI